MARPSLYLRTIKELATSSEWVAGANTLSVHHKSNEERCFWFDPEGLLYWTSQKAGPCRIDQDSLPIWVEQWTSSASFRINWLADVEGVMNTPHPALPIIGEVLSSLDLDLHWGPQGNSVFACREDGAVARIDLSLALTGVDFLPFISHEVELSMPDDVDPFRRLMTDFTKGRLFIEDDWLTSHPDRKISPIVEAALWREEEIQAS